jgi:hypothetical protein
MGRVSRLFIAKPVPAAAEGALNSLEPRARDDLAAQPKGRFPMIIDIHGHYTT